MTRQEQLNAIREVADKLGGNVKQTYSGRFMFNKTCYGIVCINSNECLELAGAKGLRGAKVDNMGKGYIVYWPSIEGEKWDLDEMNLNENY